MLEENLNNNPIIQLLQSVFNSNDGKILPIINNHEELTSINRFLYEESNSLDNKTLLLSLLYTIFNENKMLINHFIMKCQIENSNLLESIINIYYNENLDNQNKTIIERLLNLINENAKMKSIIEFIYQKVSYFFIDNNITKLNEEFLLKSFRLLQIFYKPRKTFNEEPNIDENKTDNSQYIIINKKSKKEKKQVKEIKKYIYFNGKGSSLSLILNKNSINFCSHFSTLEEGCSILFWTFLDKELTNHFFNVYQNIKVYLASINIENHHIEILFENINTFKIVVDEKSINDIDISKKFKYNFWNTICFKLGKNKIKIYINDVEEAVSIQLSKDFPINKPIDTIKLFGNFYGKISSLLFFSFRLNFKIIQYFHNNYKYGFYKDENVFQFIKTNDEEYFSNLPDYKYCKNYKNTKKTNSDNDKFFKMKLKEQHKNYLISIFVPFTYDKNKNIIDDVFGNYIGILGNEDGVCDYINFSNHINYLGGINNLLPFAEMMYIKKDVLNEKTFYEYILILENILIKQTNNLIEANKNNFFSSISLFLEKYPSSVYSNKILDIFLNIGEEVFHLSDISSTSNNNFVNMILLNEKIFSKFSPDGQFKLWEGVYKFFISTDFQMNNNYLNLSKIYLLLRFYDEKKYEEYCCKKHAELFKTKVDENKENNNIDQNEDLKIMNPKRNVKINKLFEIISLFFNKFYKEIEIVNLYKLLSLDISPCLQKKIIESYMTLLTNKTAKKEKEIIIKNLLNNNFLEISEYVLSISLLDVRIEILKLLKLILHNDSNLVKEYISTKLNSLNYSNIHNMATLNNIITTEVETQSNPIITIKTIYMFICQNLLPDRLEVEINNNSNNNLENNEGKKINYPLVNYFNKDIYEKEKVYLWAFLDSWLVMKEEQVGTKIKESKIRLNWYVLDFFISFVSSDIQTQTIYIDSFIRYLLSYLSDIKIVNRDVIFDNENIFPWLIETLFVFNNKENIKDIASKDPIKSIQENALKLYIKLLNNKKINFGNRINYIFEYSFYMKKLFKNDKKKQEEIVEITRLLLKELKELPDNLAMNDINLKTQAYFDFMFLFNNDVENLYTNDYHEYDTNMNIGYKKIKDNNLMNDIDEEDEIKKFKKQLKNFSELIPDYIYDGLDFNKDIISNSKNNNTTPKSLKDLWKDFSLYDNIIDTNRSKIWGIENVCKRVNVEYGGNPLTVCKQLIKKYRESKKCKNILLDDISKCLGIKNSNVSISSTNTIITNNNSINNIIVSSDNDSENSINVLQINLILLCLAIEVTRYDGEKEFLTGQLQEFLIFCVLASINISSSEKNSSEIQSKLYDILLFGFTFFQKNNKMKYDETFEALIKPLFGEINEQSKKGIKGLFAKKNLPKNSTILKLFIPEEKNNNNLKPKNSEDFEQEDELNSTLPLEFGFATDRKIKFRKSISTDMVYKDDTNINKKKKKKKKFVLINEDPKIITGKIFDNIIVDYIDKNKKIREGYNDSIKIFYRNIHPFTFDQKYVDEKERINKVIKELIPLVENNIIKNSNNYYLEEKKRRNELRKSKKQLFSWRGFWSNRNLFFAHPELLKVKKKNHFTKEMTQPLLTPILDIDYYLPDFKKFDKNKLFNTNNYNYRINLDINEILKEKIKDTENEDKEKKYIKNSFGFNYLECLYKLNYNGLWDLYKLYNESNTNLEEKIQKEDNNKNEPLSEENTVKSNKDTNTNTIRKCSNQEKEKEIKNEKQNFALIENTYHCCMVKLTHHIKGFINTEDYFLSFNYNNNINELDESNDPNYDKDMGSCFGSIFKSHKKDKDKINFIIKYSDIKFMFIRHYFYNESGIEIYTESNKSYYFNFRNNKDLSQFIDDVQHRSYFREIKTEDYRGKKILGYENVPLSGKKKSYSINNKMEEWQNYSISTLEYLMWLNIYSGRSFNDLTQYPVFPWVLTNYEKKSLNIGNDLRQLNLPMGMMEIYEKSIQRKETFIETYDSLKNDITEIDPNFDYQEFLKKGDEYYDYYKYKKLKREKTLSMTNPEDNAGLDTNVSILQINQIPYFYGSHYSNPTYISHYLSRTFPFSLVSIEIQGEKFDDPDRLFLSMQKTFESATSLKDDVRELIPEFYSLPEIFLNINNLNLSQDKMDSEGNKIIINNVDLPPWSKNNIYIFVSEMRKNLENSELKLNKWIDLIFGNLQRGKGAEENHNIFMAHTYERMVKIDNIEDQDSRNALMRLFEMGVTPFQLFDNESKQKIEKNVFISKNNIYSNSKAKFIEESKNIHADFINSNKFHTINNNIKTQKNETNKDITPNISKIMHLSQNTIRIITNTNHWYNLKYNISGEKKIEEESNISEIENNSNKYIASYLISSIKTPIIIYGENKKMIKGGFWDGRIELNSVVNDQKKEVISNSEFPDCGPITVMAMSKDEKYLICGTKLGAIIVYNVYDKEIQIKQKLFLYNDEITSISINDDLNMFTSASKDGYVNLHLLPTCELVRTIKVNLINKKKVGNIYANNVFLSSSPIPVIVIYCSISRIFKIYSINGLNINEKEEENYSKEITSYYVYNNLDFQDFLIYGTDDGYVKIRQFPDMEIKNSINVFNEERIETLTLSQDKRYCFVSGKGNKIGIINDI